MNSIRAARSVADIDDGLILATVDISVPPERVFCALTEDVAKWWGSEHVYRVTGWKSDLRVGGLWKSEGQGADGAPFSVEGEYLEIDPPNKLVTTWLYDWAEKHKTKLTYRLQAIATGTKLTIRHEGFKDRPQECASHSDGWEMVLAWLTEYLTRRG